MHGLTVVRGLLLFSVVAVTAVGSALTGCGPAYEVGSFDHYGRVDEPRVRALGCLDVRVQPRGEGEVGRAWIAIDYELGNRCRSPIDVNLGDVWVYAEDAGGMTPMELHDPRAEVVPAVLDGEGYASEALAYVAVGDGSKELGRLCVDVSRLVADHDQQVAPVCFRRDGDAMTVEARR